MVSYTKVENREAEFFQKIAGICSFPRTLDKSLKFGKEGKKGQIRRMKSITKPDPILNL